MKSIQQKNGQRCFRDVLRKLERTCWDANILFRCGEKTSVHLRTFFSDILFRTSRCRLLTARCPMNQISAIANKCTAPVHWEFIYWSHCFISQAGLRATGLIHSINADDGAMFSEYFSDTMRVLRLNGDYAALCIIHSCLARLPYKLTPSATAVKLWSRCRRNRLNVSQLRSGNISV